MKDSIYYEAYVKQIQPTAEAIFVAMMSTSDRNLERFEIKQIGVKATKHAIEFHKAFEEVMCGRA